MKRLLVFRTRRGPVYIARSSDGRFHPLWQDEDLGSYHSPEAAIDDVAGGHTTSPSDGTDLGELDISDDIGDWMPAGDWT